MTHHDLFLNCQKLLDLVRRRGTKVRSLGAFGKFEPIRQLRTGCIKDRLEPEEQLLSMSKSEADRKGQTGSKHSKQIGKVQGNQGISSNAADVKTRNGSFVLLFLASLAALISSYAFQYQYQSLKSGDGSKLDPNSLNDEVRIEGGWRTAAKDILVPAGPCNIPRINAKSVSQQEFLRKYAQHTPVVIGGALSSEADANEDFRRLCERENLLSGT